MRRPGRKIEVWQLNAARGEARRKGPSYGFRNVWDPKDVTEVEVKLETDDEPVFRAYGPEETRTFPTLEAARGWVKELAKELADAVAEDWREVVLVARWESEISLFDHRFVRALVSGERVRYRRGDAYEAPRAVRDDDAILELPIEVWPDLVEMGELEDWFEREWTRREARDWDWDDDEERPVEVDETERRRRFFLRYLRGRARVLRDLRDGTTVRVPVKGREG